MGKVIKNKEKILAFSRGYLAFPVNYGHPMPGCSPGFTTNSLKTKNTMMVYHSPRLHGKEEMDSSDPQVDGGHQSQRSLSHKQLAGLLVIVLHQPHRVHKVF